MFIFILTKATCNWAEEMKAQSQNHWATAASTYIVLVLGKQHFTNLNLNSFIWRVLPK